jgi:hypothetical protein
MKFNCHYNRPASKKAGTTKWSLHFKKKCYILDNIEIKVSVRTKTNKRQPYAVVTGEAKEINIVDGVGYIL